MKDLQTPKGGSDLPREMLPICIFGINTRRPPVERRTGGPRRQLLAHDLPESAYSTHLAELSTTAMPSGLRPDLSRIEGLAMPFAIRPPAIENDIQYRQKETIAPTVVRANVREVWLFFGRMRLRFAQAPAGAAFLGYDSGGNSDLDADDRNR
jgi:hypothetical protein